jgi:CheY-like chemotaxis protein
VRARLAQEVGPSADDFASTAPKGFHPKVYLPAARELDGSASALSQASASLSLLVVEDDPELSAAIMETLAAAGHRVVAQASTAQSAISQAAWHRLDLAIVDVSLAEGSSGLDVATALRDRWGVPVLFLSGGRNEHLVSFESAVGFLGKPFNGSELLAAITLAAPLLDRR